MPYIVALAESQGSCSHGMRDNASGTTGERRKWRGREGGHIGNSRATRRRRNDVERAA